MAMLCRTLALLRTFMNKMRQDVTDASRSWSAGGFELRANGLHSLCTYTLSTTSTANTMALNDLRISTFIIVASIVLFGTFYSIANKTWLDTSDPLLTHLAHPLQASHYFANKKNPLNVYFIKKAWAWCTLAFLGLFLTDPSDFSAPQRRTRLTKWAVETAVFIAFASWFFGPPLLDRLLAVSGGECVLVLPTGYVIRELPLEYCYSGAHVSPATHPGLFSATLLVPETAEWKARPRLRRGHDISGEFSYCSC